MLPRFKRALCQKIDFCLLSTDEAEDKFEVIGTQGDQYIVKVRRERGSQCSCRDFQLREGLCKHIMVICMKHYLFNFNQIKNLHDQPHLGINDVPLTTSLIGDACPICFVDFQVPEWTCEKCCKCFHYECISNWFEISTRQNMQPSCPTCRHIIS